VSEAIQAALTAKSFTIAEWCALRRLGRTRAFEEISSGRLRTYKVGRRRFISAEADAKWQRDREAETSQEA
jgi:hypothetical protein